MPDKVTGKVLAGSSPVYEVVEPTARPGSIIIRVADSHEKQFELPKGTSGILADTLNKVYEEYTSKEKS